MAPRRPTRRTRGCVILALLAANVAPRVLKESLRPTKLNDIKYARGAEFTGSDIVEPVFLGVRSQARLARLDSTSRPRPSAATYTAQAPPAAHAQLNYADAHANDGNAFWTWLPVYLVVVAAFVGPVLPQQVEMMASSALIGVIGLPHGAVDQILYEEGSADGKKHRGLFIMMYMVVMGIMAAFIHFQPVLGMAFFLMASSCHWGMSHGTSQSPRLAFLGAAIIHQLQVQHSSDVLYVCKLLAPGQPESVAGVFNVIGYAGCAGFAIMALEALFGKGSDASTRKSVMKETLLLLAVAYLSSQNSLLWSFAVYFALGHSIEAWHEQFSMRQSFTDEFSEYYSAAIPYSVAFMVGFALIAWASTYFPQGPPIAMAALLAGPLPHVMFQELALPRLDGKSMSMFGWSSPQSKR